MKTTAKMALVAAGLALSAGTASAGTLTPLASFGTNGWRAPGQILTGDFTPSNNGTTYNYLGTGNLERSFAYNPATGNLVLVSRSTAGNGIRILNGSTGVDLGPVNQGSGIITGGTFTTNAVAIGPSGDVYVSNLAIGVNTSAYKVYRWSSDAAAAPTVFFNSTNPGGSPGNNPRLGDSLAISKDGSTLAAGFANNGTSIGSGYVTIDTGSASAALRLGSSFTPAVNNAFRIGLGFGATSTDVFGKQTSDTLKIADAAANTSSVANLTSAGESPIAHAIIAGVPYLAAIDANNSTVRVYDLSNPLSPLEVALGNATTGTLSANINATGSVQWGAIDNANQTATLYAMSSNQGIQAFTFVVPTPGTGALLGLGGLLALRRRR